MIKLKLKIDLYNKYDTFKQYLHKLNLISCMVVIFVAIDPAELRPLREFGSEAGFVPPLSGKLP